MPTQTLGQRAAAALKVAKIKAKAQAKTLSWSEVAKIIDGCDSPKPAIRPGVRLAIVEAIYATYPRKVGREAAMKAIARAADRVAASGLDVVDPYAYLLERTRLYATAVAMWPQDERQYCPHPATWFNQGRYDDNTAEWQRATAKPGVVKTYDKL